MPENNSSEETKTLTGAMIRLTDHTREFFTNILPDEIPTDAYAIAWSPEGYAFYTEVEFDEFKEAGRPHEPGKMFLIFPSPCSSATTPTRTNPDRRPSETPTRSYGLSRHIHRL